MLSMIKHTVSLHAVYTHLLSGGTSIPFPGVNLQVRILVEKSGSGSVDLLLHPGIRAADMAATNQQSSNTAAVKEMLLVCIVTHSQSIARHLQQALTCLLEQQGSITYSARNSG